MAEDKSHRKHYCYTLFKNFDKLLTELQLVYELTHNGEKGREAEEILKSFLKDYLPKRYEITSGFVIGDLGLSNQCDIIIYDPFIISPIFSGYVNKIISILAVRAVIESKMQLNSKSMLIDVNSKMKALKDLYRNDCEVKQNLNKEPITVLFAYKSFGEKKRLKEILDKLEEKNIDIIFCADKGVYALIEKQYSILEPNMFYGITTDGYDASLEKHGFAVFYSYLLDKMQDIECDYSKYSRMIEYSKSSIYIDYIDEP